MDTKIARKNGLSKDKLLFTKDSYLDIRLNREDR